MNNADRIQKNKLKVIDIYDVMLTMPEDLPTPQKSVKNIAKEVHKQLDSNEGNQ